MKSIAGKLMGTIAGLAGIEIISFVIYRLGIVAISALLPCESSLLAKILLPPVMLIFFFGSLPYCAIFESEQFS